MGRGFGGMRDGCRGTRDECGYRWDRCEGTPGRRHAGRGLRRAARGRCLAAGTLTALLAGALAGTGAPAAAGSTSPGIITTVAGGPGRGAALDVSQAPQGMAAASNGTVYVSDVHGVVRSFNDTSTWERAIAGIGGVVGDSRNGVLATRARLGYLGGVAVDAAGNVVFADTYNNKIRAVAESTGTFYGRAMTAGHIYTVAGNGTFGFSGDGGRATKAEIAGPNGVAVDGSGNLVIADGANQRVRVVAATSGTFYGKAMTAGDIYTVAGNGTFGFSGDGGPATSAELEDPEGVAVDAAGNLAIADSSNERVRVVARATGTFYGKAMTAGDIYTVAGTGTAGFSGEGGPGTAAELNTPDGITVDASGNLVIADSANNRVRVLPGRQGTFYGKAMTPGDIYTVAGDGASGFSGDGGSATAAALGFVSAVTLDRSGNLVIGAEFSDRVRVVARSSGRFYDQAMTGGDIYTVGGNGLLFLSGNHGKALDAEMDTPSAIAVAGTGSGAGNYAILDYAEVRVVAATAGTFFGQAMSPGRIYGIAGTGRPGYTGDGGPAATARLAPPPGGVAFDGRGNLVIADAGNNRIRVVAAASGTSYGQPMTSGDIYTVAGNGTFGYAGDGGPATSAELNSPAAVAADGSGNMVIADTGNNRVRLVAATAGTFYGQAMTAGDIYTVAGDGTWGFSGDGGPATAAMMRQPSSVSADAAGNLVIADSGNNRVRVVAATTGTFYGQAMTAGDIYTVAGNGTFGYAGDGGPATSAELRNPMGITFDGSGNLIVADTYNERIRVVAAGPGTYYGQAMVAGDIYTVAGDGASGFLGDSGPAPAARLNSPQSVAVDSSGNLLIADSNNSRVRSVSG